MISVIATIYNRAHLLQWCLQGIINNFSKRNAKEIELNILDDGSTDNLDEVLEKASLYCGSVRKYTWDPKQSVIPRRFNCPAEPYNILVKLATGPYIYKTDPEMVVLDETFVDKALMILKDAPNAIIMPFPYHCYEFEINELQDIRNNYETHYYPTHITKDNAKYEMVYYQAIFMKDSYLNLGGIDERFANGIGSEDVNFLNWWKKEYGMDSFIPLAESPAVHCWHGGMASGPSGVPSSLDYWVRMNEQLRKDQENTKPNDGLDWGRIYDHIKLTEWKDGRCVS
jgi:hypothetical protein